MYVCIYLFIYCIIIYHITFDFIILYCIILYHIILYFILLYYILFNTQLSPSMFQVPIISLWHSRYIPIYNICCWWKLCCPIIERINIIESLVIDVCKKNSSQVDLSGSSPHDIPTKVPLLPLYPSVIKRGLL